MTLLINAAFLPKLFCLAIRCLNCCSEAQSPAISAQGLGSSKRSAPTWSWTSVDGKISHQLINSRRPYDPRSQEETCTEAFRCPWAKVKPFIADADLIEEDSTNGLVHNATLRLQGYVYTLDMGKIRLAFDIGDMPSQEELHCLPILSLKNTHSSATIKTTQVHEILLQRTKLPDGNTSGRFERVGCFWTVDPAVLDDLQTCQNLSCVEIV
jgi:hypothetical protein